MYDTDISHTVLSQITDKIIPDIKAWQSRPLEAMYCIVWLDAVHYKVRVDGKVQHLIIVTYENTKIILAKKKLSKSNFRDQIQNGQISTNFAPKKYDVPRTTTSYWIKKYSTLVQQNTGMSKLNEIKKLKERIENTTIERKSQTKLYIFRII